MGKFIIILLLLGVPAFSQENSSQFKAAIMKSGNLDAANVKKEIQGYDLAPLLTKTDNASVLGFIGKEYERIRIKFISVIKNHNKPDEYFVYGKSMVKDNVCDFQGTLQIASAYYLKASNSNDVRQGIVIGDYLLFENPQQKHVGEFKGAFKISFYIDKRGKFLYDDLAFDADGFSNNEFVGTWSSYNGKLVQICNWGDYRIPMSADLDSGGGEFMPAQKYISNGWQSYSSETSGSQTKDVDADEKLQWWNR
jgi:hypothetical protein